MARRWLSPALLLLLIACQTPPGADAGPVPTVFGIDAGFLFGGAVGGFQVESGDDASDWGVWQNVPFGGGTCPVLDCERSDDGPDFVNHYQSDITAAAATGLNAFRFSLEWERLDPKHGDAGYDAAALAYYHGLLNVALDAGMTPMATLSQGTLPLWLHDVNPQADAGGSGASPSDWIGGWRGFPGEDAGPQSQIVQAFGQYAADMAAEFGGQVRLWITLDLPMRHAEDAYLSGGFPPGGEDRLADLQQAVINLAYANAAAYDAIHGMLDAKGGLPVQVGTSNLIQYYVPVFTSDAGSGGGCDAGTLCITPQGAAEQLSYINNFLLPDAFTNGDLDPFFLGVCNYTVPVPWAGCAQAGLAGRADFIGVAYAGPQSVMAGRIFDSQRHTDLNLPGIASPLSGFDGGTTDPPLSLPIDPGDLEGVLVTVAENYPLLPIYVTELSLNENESPDPQRATYLVAATQAVQAAMAEGVDVRGIFYRSLVDDFEWQYGLEPRTGLWAVDFTDPSRPRTETLGAQAFGAIAKAGGVTPAILQDFGPP